MREIKFRGKDKENGKWRIGDLLTMEQFVAQEEGKYYIGDYETSGSFWVETESIGQFTGLHDKKGKEIYERRYSKNK